MTSRVNRATVVSVGLAVCVAALLGATLAWLRPTSATPALVASIALSLAAPPAIKALRGHLELIEPLVIVNAVLCFMFVARPTADLILGFPSLGQYSTEPTFTQALVIALVGSAAFQFGYFAPWGRRLAAALPSPPNSVTPRAATVAAAVVLILSLALFLIFLLSVGGVGAIAVLFGGRSLQASALYFDSTGYVYAAPLLAISTCVTALALALVSTRRRLLLLALCGVSAIFVFVTSLPQGNRSGLLSLFLPVVAVWYMVRGRRPRLLSAIIAAYLVVTLGFVLTQTRFAVDRPDSLQAFSATLTNPLGAVGQWVTGADGAEFDTLAIELQAVPSTIPFSPGATLSDLATRAVPRPLWPDKPLERGDALTVGLFPDVYQGYHSGLLPSILGILYMDFGILTVIAGMCFVGTALALLWRYYQIHRLTLGGKLLYATSLPAICLIVRDTPGEVVSGVAFSLVPLVFILWWSRRATAESPESARAGAQLTVNDAPL